ncbi:PREDICTED: uncharacterized protein LOC105958561 [Erythranthe guttata]|uniref:uncharacterized protein LOC105958561 n=1 Tax=Erythranthe guttata TaxID=4155 RepID=UPI00064E115E|nr:PREDICTED: uncharacterized protein LOC105958561 [Erythranthe guttata]|eukprot:XP_012838021.1 PREDICTED: uncharacterized protein LOC105958561 [Erythranthe guttata]
MGFLFSLITLTIFLSLQTSKSDQNQHLLLDQIIKDYTFKSYTTNSKTGKLHAINLPSNLSGVKADAIKLRCGSLQRYGAKIQEFRLSSGLNIRPCAKRVILLRQNLGSNWSSIYYNSYKLSSAYQLIAPVLALLAYTGPGKNVSTIEMPAGKNPIAIDFSSTEFLNDMLPAGIISPLCVRFDENGKITFLNRTGPNNVCVSTSNGYFGLVAEMPLYMTAALKSGGKEVGKWKIVTVGSIGGALGAALLSLLTIAMFVNAKKKIKKEEMDELERRAYEEEALRVSMVGHVRGNSGNSCTRTTVPTIHHYYHDCNK